ncbi:protein of unknown function [Rhodovastum atsumiense]|nr:prepilin-type N-terminal cleavage/methylation domain-containing protein [Rhodovastum atsumiense]CAH2602665.1 protein of unknown function [Rhodovastum atsumiense]
MMRTRRQPLAEVGFTLMELLVALAILSVAAYAALDTVAQDTGPTRFQDTRQRLEMIRTAVLGQPGRSVNGEPDIAGFVADIGRLPKNPQELISRPGADTADTSDDIPEWGLDAVKTTGLYVGWRGPYLLAFREVTSKERAFRDGWGNIAKGKALASNGENTSLFGWHRFGSATDNLYVQSYGADGKANEVNTYNNQDAFLKDYPPSANPDDPTGLPDPLVAASDWRVALGQLQLRLVNRSGTNLAFTESKICAALYYVSNGKVETASSTPTPLPATSLAAGDAALVTLPFSKTPWLPMGRAALRLFLTASDNTCNSTPILLPGSYDRITEKRCSTDFDKATPGLACGTRLLTLLPPAMPAQIDWDLTWR